MSPPKVSTIVKSRWLNSRLWAASTFFDIIDYIVLLAGIAVIYHIGVTSFAFIDPNLIEPIHYMEQGANMGLIACFFWRMFLRAYKNKP
jgi:hypothetical protein